MRTIKNETRRQVLGTSFPAAALPFGPLSCIAGAVALLAASGGSAWAANECGTASSQILCTANAYTGGISYVAPAANPITLTLDNPNMVVSGGSVQLRQQASSNPAANYLIQIRNVASITAANAPVSVQGLVPGTTVGVSIDNGAITSTANASITVQAFASGNANAQVTVNGGLITNAGLNGGSAINAVASGASTTGNATLTINGGTVQALGTVSTGALSQITGANATGSASLILSGGSVSGAARGLWAHTTGTGQALISMSGGNAFATGSNGDGMLASATTATGTFRVDMTGGTVTGGSGFGAAIHTSARSGGVLNVGAGAIVNAGASGVAIRNGDFNQDGVDEIAGNVAMTLGGTINGHVLMGAGTDTLTITGGSIAGNLVADANDALTFDTGANRFVHGSAYAITDFGSITMRSGDVRLDSRLTGGTLTINGGALELTNAANAYTGGTFLNGGLLSISSDANLGAAGTTLAIDGGTLRGTADFSTGRTITLGTNGGTFQADAPMAVTSAITGPGGLTKTGGSTLTLSAAQGYTGATTISDGTLALTGNGSLASSSRVIANGILDIAGVSGPGTGVQSLGGNGEIVLGDRTLTVSAASGSFDGVISGTGGLTIAGGTQSLSGVHLYTGETTIASSGTLALTGGGSIAASSRVVADGVLDLSGASGASGGSVLRSLAGTGQVTLGANTLTLSNAADSFGGVISGTGGLTIAGGTQTLTRANDYLGDTTINPGATLLLSGSGANTASRRVVVDGRFDISGIATVSRSIQSLTGTGTVDLGGKILTLLSPADTFSGTIVGTGGINLAPGHLTLTGVNAYTGSTMIGWGSTLTLTGDGAIATSSRVTAEGVLDIAGVNGGGTSIRRLSGSGVVQLGGNTLTLSAAGDTFLGSIQGSGGLTIAGGAQTLSGVNGFTGVTTIADGGTLALSGAGSIASSARIVADGLLDISSSANGGTSIRSLSGSGVVQLGGNTLTLSAAGHTFDGALLGSGGLTVAGGTQTLSGVQFFTGDATIAQGATLAMAGGGSLNSAHRVVADGRFELSGINASAADIRSLAGAGTVDLGGKTLTLTAAGDSFGGTLVGTGGLSVAAGAQTLSGVNPYTGDTRIAGGATLALSGQGSIASSARVLADGLLDLSTVRPANASIRSLAGGGMVNLGGQSLTLTHAADTFGGAINGTGGLTIAGGTQTLSGANGYSGDTVIASGAMLAMSGNGAIAGSNRVVVDGGFDVSGTASGASIRSLAGSGAVTLGGQTLTLSAAADTFSGGIAGSGGLAVGGGTQVLTGSSTYTGGTHIQSGTLQLGDGGTSGSIVGDVINRGTLVFHRSDAVSFGNLISGDGLIRQIGSGLTRITADNSGFIGSTRVEAGTLAVDGTLGGATQVLAGARLQGNGTVGSLNVAGTVAPGNSIGALHAAGDFSQTRGSVYQVEVDPDSTRSDQLLIAGKATLADGAQLDIVRTDPSAAYRLNTRYTVLTANGGLTGTYLLTGDTRSAFIKLVDQYDANHVYLVAEQVREFSDVAQTPNQIAVGGALDQSTATNDMLTAIGWLPDEDAARDAFDQLSGEIHATLKSALIEDSRFIRETALARMRVDACGASLSRMGRVKDDACVDASGSFQGWAQVYGATGSLDTDGNAHRAKRHLSGFMLGADRALGDGWRIGGLAGYNRSTVDVRADDARVDQFHLGAYASWQSGANALRFGASHSWASADVRREVRFLGFEDALASTQDSRLLQVFGEAARRVDLHGLALEPFVNVAYVMLHSDALAERGGLAALRAAGGDDRTGFATAGLRMSREVNAQTRLQAQVGWRRAFGDTTPMRAMSFADDTRFELRGLPIARDAASLELGAETQWRPGAVLSLVYSGQYSGAMEDHGVRLRASWVF